MEMKVQPQNTYYLGLDIGTDSVGYAVTDADYNLRKYKGEPIWGVTTFDAASQSEERRSFRTARRRLDRRQWRLRLLSEVFAGEMAKVDDRFFIRLQESALYRDDVSNRSDRHIYFNDDGYNDSNYFKQYPTIHHLICELMESDEPHDIRLVYLAIAWLIVHRGHFLSDISQDNVDAVSNFTSVYQSLMAHFDENSYDSPWLAEAEDILNILQMKLGVSGKEKAFAKLLYGGKMPKDKVEDFDSNELESHPYNRASLLKLLSGGKVAPKDLFLSANSDYSELSSLTLSMKDEDLEAILGELGDDGEIVTLLKALYDAATLIDLLNGENRISKAKVAVYKQHRTDLKTLKYLIKKYLPEKYTEVFRNAKKGLCNYVAYSYNVKSIKDPQAISNLKKTNKEDFCKYIKSIVKNIHPEEQDVNCVEDILKRLERTAFMPKQVDSDNRVIPYQLYRIELTDILKRASGYLPFLTEADADGITPAEKIVQIFEFRVPYFVGPLHKSGQNTWIVKKPGKLFPWNFDELVDQDASEQEFIRRLINRCTYLPTEDVLPKDSLLYSKFCVLNEINNIKIDGTSIPVELKQHIYNDVFLQYSRVTVKKIKDYCIANGYMTRNAVLEGLDVNVQSSLRSHIDFRRLLSSGKLREADVEAIIARSAYSDNKYRFKQWLIKNYPDLPEEDIAYIASKRYKDFGRLSKKFLTEFYGTDVNGNGEAFSIIDGLWNTNFNLMQLLSDQYTFADAVDAAKQAFYAAEEFSLSDRLDSMYVSNAVKRPIVRTFDIVSEVSKVMGCAPTKIFVEMARGAIEKQKGKRTKSRKDQIYDLYDTVKDEDLSALRAELEGMGDQIDNRLQSERLYLYYLQLGKCMYSGAPINLDQLMNDKIYDVDHIYPQSLVKDDSITNKVLVLSTLNAEKSDKYPIDPEIQKRMGGYWKKLLNNKLISEEKYKRLTRKHSFTDEERMGFINRQLVETRQSTKAVATLLKEKYPDCEIVYVKAGLVSDFRHQYDLLKSRTVNDLHHAKDAYLNIVVGNVYDTKFSKHWFKLTDHYNLKTDKIFAYPVKHPNGTVVWQGEESIGNVKRNYRKNHVHITRYAFCRKGGLFDQMPLKAASGLVPRKTGLSTEKYGGYNKPTASFFALVKYSAEKNTDVLVVPVELMFAERYKNDETFREDYTKRMIAGIIGKSVNAVSFPLGERILKVNTVFELDGIRLCLSGKSSGGKTLLLLNVMPFVCSASTEEYIRCIEKFNERLKKNESLRYDPHFSQLSAEKNLALYDLYIQKLSSWPYNKRPANPVDTLINGRNKFIALSVPEQAKCLGNIQMIFGRIAGGTDLTLIGGVAKAGVTTLSSALSNWKRTYSEVRIIDQSAAGLYEQKSQNLLELL